MVSTSADVVGSVVSLWRYPVKSMMGEELNATEITSRGLLGDRAFALFDPTTGKVASAKQPRKWARLFDFRAAFVEPPEPGRPLPPARIWLPDGSMLLSTDPSVDSTIASVLGRACSLTAAAPDAPSLEEYWPDIEGLAFREAVTDEPMPPETFFDAAVIHVLTTSTINRLRELYPHGRFEARRFRPNIVLQPPSDSPGFVEDEWVGREVAIGENVVIRVLKPCSRCVMTTLPQGDLPQDYGILRTAAQHNQANVGVYASVVRGGMVRRGDPAFA